MEETIRLTKRREFEAVLADYKMSAQTIQYLKQTTFVLVVAPTATGRNTVISELLNTGNYYFIVSDTTRPPEFRDGRMEENGREYFFRSEDEVLHDVQTGGFVEAAIIHQHWVSGVSAREIKKAYDLNKIAITDVEVVGAHNIHQAKPDTICIFMLPPNFEEWQRRLKHRGEMSPVIVQRRMESAVKELTAALEHDYYTFVINDTVENAVTEVNHIARLGEVDPAKQAAGHQLAEQLLIEARLYLKG